MKTTTEWYTQASAMPGTQEQLNKPQYHILSLLEALVLTSRNN